jgi:CBS domain containing-hemolysin-like protein
LFLVVLALVAEAFFEGAETAFVSINFLKLMHLIEKKNKRAMLVHDLIKKPDRLLTTTLLGTNLSVVVSAVCATAIIEKFYPAYSALLTTVVLTPITFIFCQLLPKAVARYNANRICLFLAGPLKWSEKVFWPFVNFFVFFANTLGRIVSPKGLRKNPFLTKDDIKSLIKDISREGILEAHEKEAIDKIFDMTLARAADIMVPIKNVAVFDAADTLEAVKAKARASGFTRFPVLKGKELAGIINIFDIFYNPVGDWQAFIRPLIRVEHDQSVDKAFSSMQPGKEVIAAVFKGPEMAGILTIEDLMEDIAPKLKPAK